MLYLASGSPRRARLLKEARLRYRVLKTDYKESHPRGMSPALVVRKNALGKALAASGAIKKGIILAADTIVYCNHEIIGKPKNRRAAEKILYSLQGRWHTVYTGVVFLKMNGRKIEKKIMFHEKTTVRLLKMSLPQIRRYFQCINPMDKAGAYAIQTQSNPIVKELRGSFSNAVGLPMEKLKKRLDMLK